MAVEVIMPKWGLTMKEGKLARWLKNEGENVQAGEPLFEVETDKITNSVEAPADGVLAQIVVPAGETAPVQAVLGVIAAPGEKVERVSGGAAAPASEAPDSAAANAGDAAPAAQEADEEFVPAMPAARRLAKELGVRLSTVTGSGPDGRITVKDVKAAAEAGGGINATPQAIEFAKKKGVDLADVQGSGEDGKITKADILRAMNPNYAAGQQPKPEAASSAPKSEPATTPAAAAVADGEDTIVPMEGMRKIIADNMHSSLTNAAQLTVFVEADVTEMVALRRTLLERNKRNSDYRLSYNDIIACAVCRALKRHPVMNATLQEDGIHQHAHVNLGIAVALPEGLIVPNVKQADTYGLEELAVRVRDVAGRARKGGLSMDEIAGGTFTISNVSMLGVDGFTPILNPPEAGILGVGRVVEKPAVKNGEICIRSMMTLSLTFNHMVTDGAPAMTFLRELADMLEQPGLMMA
jgi:pyruvate dehydrogenase E2 component (dihydrolipoamide acetyltransferase)